MAPSIVHVLVLTVLLVTRFTNAQSGYTGYNRTQYGDPESVIYDTASSPSNISTEWPEPDVFLNASVHVGEIDLTVLNISAKINLDAQVLQLLQFNAGVSASIDRVSLVIKEVNADVLLEARLSNLLLMIGSVLDSLDLNPILATLGQDVSNIVNHTVDTLTGQHPPTKRSFILEENILYSVNDYSGHTHTNRILAQDGTIFDQSLDNQGHVYDQHQVGTYLNDMRYNGHDLPVTRDGKDERMLEYVYEPFPGLSVVSAIYTDAAGNVVGTQVLSEGSGGGSSTIDSDEV